MAELILEFIILMIHAVIFINLCCLSFSFHGKKHHLHWCSSPIHDQGLFTPWPQHFLEIHCASIKYYWFIFFFFFFHFIAYIWEGGLSGKKLLAQGNSKRIVVRSCHILCYAYQVFFTYFGAATTILCWYKNLKRNKQQNKVYSFCNPPSFSVIPWANFCNRGDGWFLLGTHGRNQNLGRILLPLHCILSNKITNTPLTIQSFSWIFNIFFCWLFPLNL